MEVAAPQRQPLTLAGLPKEPAPFRSVPFPVCPDPFAGLLVMMTCVVGLDPVKEGTTKFVGSGCAGTGELGNEGGGEGGNETLSKVHTALNLCRNLETSLAVVRLALVTAAAADWTFAVNAG